MIELKIVMNDADKARAKATLKKLEQLGTNPAGGLRVVGEALLKEQNRRFKSESAPDGSTWAKSSSLTQEIRGKSGPILTVFGALMRSGACQVSGKSVLEENAARANRNGLGALRFSLALFFPVAIHFNYFI